jgi:hypothetical protein
MLSYIYEKFINNSKEIKIDLDEKKRIFFENNKDYGNLNNNYLIYKIKNNDLKKLFSSCKKDEIKTKHALEQLKYLTNKISYELFYKIQPLIIYYNELGCIYIIIDMDKNKNGKDEYKIISRIVSMYIYKMNKYIGEYFDRIDVENVEITKKAFINKRNLIDYLLLKQKDSKNNILQKCRIYKNDDWLYGYFLLKTDYSETILNSSIKDMQNINLNLKNKIIYYKNIITEIIF